MTNKADILQGAKNLSTNLDDLINDIDDLEDEHEHSTWSCGECENMVDEEINDKVSNFDVSDLMDMNYSLWSEIGEEAVNEYKERTEDTLVAIQTLANLVNELYDVAETTDTQDVVNAITLLLEGAYGANLKADEPDLIQTILQPLDEQLDGRNGSCDCCK